MLGCRPVERWDADRAAMLGLPPVAPVTGWRLSTRLPRDHYIRLAANDYSVHPSVIGRRVEVAADLDQVSVTCAGVQVAHHRRCWAKHQSITDADHKAAAVLLRQRHRTLTAVAQAPVQAPVQYRDLADYDRMFGTQDLAEVA